MSDVLDPSTPWRDRVRQAVGSANVPALLMVLIQLTDDPRWLGLRYRPDRSRGVSDNDTGGLPAEVQQEIKDAAVEALLDWDERGRPQLRDSSMTEFVSLLDVYLGEHVDPAYGPMMASEAGFPRAATRPISAAGGKWRSPSVVVIGAGLSGICAGVQLDAAGFDYTVIEKNADVGGTWYENRYPGAGVDTPSHLYSYSFETDYPWTRYYAKRDEIHAYLRHCADKYDVLRHIEFETEVLACTYDEARCAWTVVTRGPDGTESSREVDVVMAAVGQLNRPKPPAVPGLGEFAGPLRHTAEWDPEIDLTGRRLAVIGTGASAMQMVPAVAEQVESMVVFQRSPQWAGPNEKYFTEVTPEVAFLMAEVPGYAAWYRLRLLWIFNDKVHASLQIDPSWPAGSGAINATNDGHRRFFTEYMRRELAGAPELLDSCLPHYPPFGKRMLIDNGWFKALSRDNVRLETGSVDHVDANGLVMADGRRYDVDVIALASGFETHRMLAPIRVTGRGGRDIRGVWGEDDAAAYLGITVPGFPNLFLLYGPNTNLGHGGSIVFNAECQVRYVVSLLAMMADKGIDAVECKESVFDAYVADVDEAHSRMVWSHPDVDTWYRNAAGRVVTNSPWRLVDYRAMTLEANLDDYHLSVVGDSAPDVPDTAGQTG